MRRLALVAVAAFVFTPAAHAACGLTASALSGAAPLTVTYTAQCESSAYAWDFGDGTVATGQTVSHTFAAGVFRPVLTSDTGTETSAPVLSIALRVTAPKRAAYASYVALRATVVPRLPVTWHGRRFVNGKLRVRVLGPGPWTVEAGGVHATTSTTVEPKLVVSRVRAVEERLAALRYAVRVDGAFGDDDTEALYAFQKVEGLPRTGIASPEVWRRLLAAQTPRPRYGGDHVEIDKARQVLFVVRGGKVALVVATSTGATGNTPVGTWHVYRKVTGFDWVLYYPNYFLRGFAVHGYPDVPPYPASHGCARIPMWIAQTVYAQIAMGSEVIVY